jgi:MoxR-like ATPase
VDLELLAVQGVAEFVTPDHVRAVMHDCLRHRLILSYEALSQGVTADQAIDKIG